MRRSAPAARTLAFALALAALSLAVLGGLYARTLGHGLVWMDVTEIGEGEILLGNEPWTSAFTRPLHRSDAGTVANPYYRPLQILVASAVHAVAGPSPPEYRIVSLAAALGTCLAFGALARRLFGLAAPALIATALAAAHPAGIESWLWISGLGEALSALFAIASLGLGVRSMTLAGGAGRTFRALSLAGLVVALGAKEKAVVVPALLAAALVAFELGPARARSPWHDVAGARRRGLDLVAAQALVAVLYLFAWRPAMLGSALTVAPPIGGSATTHLLSALATWPASLRWLLVPWHSSTSDAVRVVHTASDPAVLAGAALALGSLAAFAWLVRRGRPVAAFGLAWVWIAFLPTANLLPQIHAHAERYLFLSVFGAALLVTDAIAWVLGAGARAAPAPARWRRAAAAALGALLALGLASRTAARTPDWRTTRTLFEVDVGRDPGFREGRYHLARALFETGLHAEADAHLRLLREPDPSAAPRWSYLNGVGLRELACANDLALGRHESVTRELEQLARRDPALAARPSLRACLAQAHETAGRLEEARTIYAQVAEGLAGPPPAPVSLALARLDARLGRPDEARRWLEMARRDGPREPGFDWQLRQVEKALRAGATRLR